MTAPGPTRTCPGLHHAIAAIPDMSISTPP